MESAEISVTDEPFWFKFKQRRQASLFYNVEIVLAQFSKEQPPTQRIDDDTKVSFNLINNKHDPSTGGTFSEVNQWQECTVFNSYAFEVLQKDWVRDLPLEQVKPENLRILRHGEKLGQKNFDNKKEQYTERWLQIDFGELGQISVEIRNGRETSENEWGSASWRFSGLGLKGNLSIRESWHDSLSERVLEVEQEEEDAKWKKEGKKIGVRWSSEEKESWQSKWVEEWKENAFERHVDKKWEEPHGNSWGEKEGKNAQGHIYGETWHTHGTSEGFDKWCEASSEDGRNLLWGEKEKRIPGGQKVIIERWWKRNREGKSEEYFKDVFEEEAQGGKKGQKEYENSITQEKYYEEWEEINGEKRIKR